MIKAIFLGSPEFSSICLDALIKDAGFDIPLIVTQPSRHAGRKRELKPTDISIYCAENNLECVETKNINQDDKLIQRIKEIKPHFLIVVAFGQMLTKEIIKLPQIDTINVHASLLPKYRGASPIHEALLNGDSKTGVSIMSLVRKMDAGPVYAKKSIEIATNDDIETLYDQLANMGSKLLVVTLRSIKNDKLTPTEQNESEVTHCKKIQKSDGLINFIEMSADEIYNKWRAYKVWPNIFFRSKGKMIKLIKITKKESDATINQINTEGEIGCKAGSIQIEELQMEGKKVTTWDSFKLGGSEIINEELN